MTDAATPGEEAPRLSCPICGVAGDHRIHRAREMMFGTREAFEYRECLACGTLRIADIPSDLARHYPPAYYGAGQPDAGGPRAQRLGASALGPVRLWQPVNRWRVQTALRRTASRWPGLARRLDRWGGIPRQARTLLPLLRLAGIRCLDDPLLEAGTGRRAERLVALRRAGFRRLVGIEPFVERDLIDRGIEIRRGTLEAMPGQGSWALVMLHHVFEHVPDPRATLLAAHRLLRPNGACLIWTPFADSDLWRRYGPDWYELDPPRHLFVFTRRAIAGLANETGFTVEAEVDDATEVERILSEQYRRDISLYDPRSWFVDPGAAGLASGDLVAWRAEAREMNATRTAGRGALVLRRS
jgi:SAM-dependent methyltransferase